ncbi:plasmid pRiA4b ORF-3 family protein [Sphingobium sp. YR768]|uniref:plasmid pRiA4b ORF-3 family protein n=1 Tax=Sphingobium sp. YR768 TaxID=1884365 RepID=UPI0008D42458|nr:plasmid pRiA4b ORF-3 family protein [Sphingobium sp. YR768]SES11119.1 pRiA4b ORF-3-like protein [Sphingobium sp. YR768]
MSNSTIVRMKITLDDVTPAVSRTLEVPLNIRLDRLHTVIQTAFSWTDSHLWEMRFGQTGFGIPDPEYGFDGPLDARKATLAQVLADTRRRTFRYLYDFGDDHDPNAQPDIPLIEARLEALAKKWAPRTRRKA